MNDNDNTATEQDAISAFEQADFTSQSEDDPESTPDTEEQAGDEAADEEQDDSLEIGGEKYTREELEELISKGKDYTKKTQALAEERKALEASQKEPDMDPEEKVERIAEALYGRDVWESTLDTDKAMHRKNIEVMQTLVSELEAVKAELKEATAETRASKEMKDLAAKWSEKVKVKLTPEQVKGALDKANGDKEDALILILNQRHTPTVRKDKPVTPGATRTPDKGAPKNVDDVIAEFSDFIDKNARRTV